MDNLLLVVGPVDSVKSIEILSSKDAFFIDTKVCRLYPFFSLHSWQVSVNAIHSFCCQQVSFCGDQKALLNVEHFFQNQQDQ